MHPFHWAPAGGARHASRDSKPTGGNYPTGTFVTTLCGSYVAADNSDMAWLWETCAACNKTAHALAAVPTAHLRAGAR